MTVGTQGVGALTAGKAEQLEHGRCQQEQDVDRWKALHFTFEKSMAVVTHTLNCVVALVSCCLLVLLCCLVLLVVVSAESKVEGGGGGFAFGGLIFRTISKRPFRADYGGN